MKLVTRVVCAHMSKTPMVGVGVDGQAFVDETDRARALRGGVVASRAASRRRPRRACALTRGAVDNASLAAVAVAHSTKTNATGDELAAQRALGSADTQ